MIPRFSLYRDPSNWNSDIQEDPQGQWVKWKDVEPYLDYSATHGFVTTQPQTQDIKQLPMFGEDTQVLEILDEDDLLLDDGEDVYDLITKSKRRDYDDVDS